MTTTVSLFIVGFMLAGMLGGAAGYYLCRAWFAPKHDLSCHIYRDRDGKYRTEILEFDPLTEEWTVYFYSNSETHDTYALARARCRRMFPSAKVLGPLRPDTRMS